MNITELRKTVKDAVARMQKAVEALDNPQTGADVSVLEQKFDEARTAHTQATERLERAEALAEARSALPVGLDEPDPDLDLDRRSAVGSISVGEEPATYRSGGSHSFMQDQLHAQRGDKGAIERLVRNAKELVAAGKLSPEDAQERVIAETAGTGGELVAPLFLQNEYLALARAARPFFDLLTKRPLPPNTNSINIPRLKTGTATAAQSDLGAVQSTDITTSLLTFPVITVAGQEDFARQLFDRAVPELADMVVFPDLVADYLTKTDIQAISGSGEAPNAKGVLSSVPAGQKVTFTSGTPTVKEVYKKIADGIQRIHTKRFLPPTAIVMHPRRWAWLLAAVDSNERPLFLPATNSFNAAGVQDGVVSQGFVGTVQGLPVYVDPSLPTNQGASTNQDPIIILRASDSWALEDSPIKTRVYEEVLSGTLAVRAQVFNYLALTHERYPEGLSLIEGTGLVAPTF